MNYTVNERLFENFLIQLNKMEVYLQKELRERPSKIIIFSLFLLIPSLAIKTICIFVLSTAMLGHDIKNQRDQLFYFLPFSRKELFWYNFIFLLLLVITTSMISYAALPISYTKALISVLKTISLLLSVYGLAIFFSGIGLDSFGWTLIVIILDAVIGGFGSNNIHASDFNPYSAISFTHQHNVFLSLIFSMVLCALGYFAYLKRGGEV